MKKPVQPPKKMEKLAPVIVNANPIIAKIHHPTEHFTAAKKAKLVKHAAWPKIAHRTTVKTLNANKSLNNFHHSEDSIA